MPNRRQRLERIGNHTEVISDTLLSGVLQTTREALGATLEGKNLAFNKIGERLKISPRNKKWYAKTRRALGEQGIGRLIKAANGMIDTVGIAAISSIDIVNNTQGAIHDMFTGKNTSKGIIAPLLSGAFNDVLWRKAIKQSLIDGLIMNKKIDTNFDASSGRTYGINDKKTVTQKRNSPVTGTKKPTTNRKT